MVVGDLETAVEVVILGAGPGGYVAAIRAAQLGKDVAIIDPGPLGGTCLNVGCIPSKALLTAAGRFNQLTGLAEMGIHVSHPKFDLGQTQRWKEGIVSQLSRGVQHLLDKNEVQIYGGKGWFIGPKGLRVEGEHGSQRFSFEQCIIAVGAEPAPWPGLPFDGQRVLTSSQALALTERPKDIVIIGADYIAAELATFFAKIEVPVRLLIPEGETLLAAFDPAAARQVRARFKKLGVTVEAKVADPVTAVAEATLVVVSTGLVPRTQALDLVQVGVESDAAGFIPVNDCMQSSNPAIYAVGDVTGGLPLATLAIKQAKVAAEHLAGRPAQYAPQAIPQVAWTDPPLAAVGLTADEAQAVGYEVVTARFPLAANGRALTLDAAEGFALVVAEQDSEVLLGVTLVGAGAEILISEAALALEMGATLTDLAETLHPHPGLGEPLQEAAEAALGWPVHVLKG
jgi:dihydrolipoamide dehydrogenase